MIVKKAKIIINMFWKIHFYITTPSPLLVTGTSTEIVSSPGYGECRLSLPGSDLSAEPPVLSEPPEPPV